jgi:hypothetical protein
MRDAFESAGLGFLYGLISWSVAYIRGHREATRSITNPIWRAMAFWAGVLFALSPLILLALAVIFLVFIVDWSSPL